MNKTTKIILWVAILVGFLVLIGILASNSSQNVPGQDLQGVTWEWISMQKTDLVSPLVVPSPQNYTIRFNADGSVNIQADCNQVLGSYTTDGSSLTITTGPTSLAYCGEASLDQVYLQALSLVISYDQTGQRLALNFQAKDGKMDFFNNLSEP
jgi:heat shock protein HslJ